MKKQPKKTGFSFSNNEIDASGCALIIAVIGVIIIGIIRALQ